MKRSFSTLTCMNLGLEELAALAQRNGMEGIEIRLDGQQKICGLGADEADKIRKTLGELTITDLATGVSAADYSEAMLEMGRACIELADAVNCRAIRIFVGGSTPKHSIPPKQDEDGIVRFLRELCPIAAEKNVEVWAETHSSYSSAQAMGALLDRAGMPNLKVIWDVLHSIEYRETPAQSAEYLGSRIAHIHLKDAKSSGDPDATQYIHTALGCGEFPLTETLRCLKALNYDGYLSLEWELPWRPELKDCYRDADETLAAFNKWLDAAEAELQ